MINMKSINISRSQQRCYRLLSPKNPSKSQHKNKQILPVPYARISQQAISLIKSHKYIYLDIIGQSSNNTISYNSKDKNDDNTAQSFVRGMEITTLGEQNNPQEDQQIEKIDKYSLIKNLNALSTQSQKFVDYMLKAKQIKKQRKHFNQINKKKQQNMKLIKNRKKFKTEVLPKCEARKRKILMSLSKKQGIIYTLDNEALRKRAQRNQFKTQLSKKDDRVTRIMPQQMYMHHGLKISQFKEYLRKKQMKQININIQKKQDKLANRYGLQRQFLNNLSPLMSRPHTQLVPSNNKKLKNGQETSIKTFSHYRFIN